MTGGRTAAPAGLARHCWPPPASISGLHTAAAVSAVLLAVDAVLTVTLLRQVGPIGETQHDRIPTAGPCSALATTARAAGGSRPWRAVSDLPVNCRSSSWTAGFGCTMFCGDVGAR